jgi:DMSO/TMAO reductase YedYZ heme-binding membrane subunit
MGHKNSFLLMKERETSMSKRKSRKARQRAIMRIGAIALVVMLALIMIMTSFAGF